MSLSAQLAMLFFSLPKHHLHKTIKWHCSALCIPIKRIFFCRQTCTFVERKKAQFVLWQFFLQGHFLFCLDPSVASRSKYGEGGENVWTWGFQGEIHWQNYVWECHSKLERFERRFKKNQKKTRRLVMKCWKINKRYVWTHVDVQPRLQFFWECNFERRLTGLAQQPTAEEETHAANLKAQRGRRDAKRRGKTQETTTQLAFAPHAAVCVVSQQHLR